MWVPHKELKKNKKMQSIIWKKKTDAETEVCFFFFFSFFFSLLSFLDSRVSDRQNSSG